jgi:integrase
MQKRSMHVLRKTYATRLINSGIDEAIIINQLGHTEIDTTKQYYYYNDKSIKQIAEKIEFVMNF